METEQIEELQRLISHGVDWSAVLSLSVYHRVFALVHTNLKRHHPGAMPREIEEELTERFLENQRRMMEMTGELLRLIGAFEAKDITAIPVKGPSLAATVYGKVALRPAGDLDILVKPEDVPEALDVLRSAGYSVILHGPGTSPSARQEAAVFRYLYHFALVNEERDSSVELHFSLSPKKNPYRVTPAELIERSFPWVLGGREIRILNAEDNLLFLCMHGGRHAWPLLEWVTGVGELLCGNEGLDEQRLWRIAEERGASLALLLGLLLVRELYRPGFMLHLTEKAAETPVVSRLCTEMVGRLGEPELDSHAQARFQLALCPSIHGKLRWYFYSGFLPRNTDLLYANAPACLYWLIRPLRIAHELPACLARRKNGVPKRDRYASANR